MLGKNRVCMFRVFTFRLVRFYCDTPKTVRVRFAPSPTGFIHLGGLRTIAYNFLMARSSPGGRFILRIEDTDQERIVPGAAEKLESTLRWLGMEPDESPAKGGPFGPYVQSQRLHMYQNAARILMERQLAYRCFCSADRLMLMKKEALKNRELVRYDNRCRHLKEAELERKLKAGDPYVVRLILKKEPCEFVDQVFGRYEYHICDLEGDPVILKSDGYPTYHLANVIDDHAMEITHVIRGEEWLQSTVKHCQLYAAFKWKPPLFAHIPLLLTKQGAKLSKRDSAAHLDSYIKEGYYPLVLINFVLSTGGGFDWTKKEKSSLYSLKELIEYFDLYKLTKRATKLEPDYLDKYNMNFLRSRSLETDLIPELRKYIDEQYGENASSNFDQAYLRRILTQYLNDVRATTLKKLVAEPDNEFLWRIITVLDPEILNFTKMEDGKCVLGADDFVKLLRNLIDDFDRYFSNLGDENYTLNNVKEFLKNFEKNYGVAHKTFFPLLRRLLTKNAKGLPISEMFYVLGKAHTLKRLENGLELLKNGLENEDRKIEEL